MLIYFWGRTGKIFAKKTNPRLVVLGATPANCRREQRLQGPKPNELKATLHN